ncbi:MAG TPA: thiol reductase thioredoxin, partial [Planctomycetaceae bacterium]|nr:thiol reductase thioredoxin [Planctomycetaceae bacterium]
VNIDDNPGSAERFGVNSIPTLMVFRNGQVSDSFVGVRPKTQLQAAIS